MDAKAPEFPYKRRYGNMREKICQRFHRLATQWRTRFVVKPYKINNAPDFTAAMLHFRAPPGADSLFTRTFPQTRGNGAPVILKLSSRDYEDYNLISDYFIEQHRITAFRGDDPARESVLDYWNANARRIRTTAELAIPRGIANREEKVIERMREIIWQQKMEVGTFRPTIAVSIVQLMRDYFGEQCEHILVPCAGWGDRLIGFAAIGLETLVDVDPNERLAGEYERMMEWTHECMPGARLIKHRTYFCAPFEDIADRDLLNAIHGASYFDLVLCAPPYFDIEIYTLDETQSIMRYNTFEKWFTNFLLVIIRKGAMLLRTGGIYALIINQSTKARTDPRERFLSRMIRECERFTDDSGGRIMEYMGVISYAEVNEQNGTLRSPQPIWLWRRI